MDLKDKGTNSWKSWLYGWVRPQVHRSDVSWWETLNASSQLKVKTSNDKKYWHCGKNCHWKENRQEPWFLNISESDYRLYFVSVFNSLKQHRCFNVFFVQVLFSMIRLICDAIRLNVTACVFIWCFCVRDFVSANI